MHDAEEVAARFSALLRGDEFAGRFRVVLFAVIKSRHNLSTFSARFPMLSDADVEALLARQPAAAEEANDGAAGVAASEGDGAESVS